MNPNPKKLYRSKSDRVFAGVCGGLAKYFDADPTVFRLVWAVIVVFSGIFPGVLAYILAAIIVPEEPAAPAGPVEAEKV